jgi:hypothetical protein
MLHVQEEPIFMNKKCIAQEDKIHSNAGASTQPSWAIDKQLLLDAYKNPPKSQQPLQPQDSAWPVLQYAQYDPDKV